MFGGLGGSHTTYGAPLQVLLVPNLDLQAGLGRKFVQESELLQLFL
jgi:hypothetical protein